MERASGMELDTAMEIPEQNRDWEEKYVARITDIVVHKLDEFAQDQNGEEYAQCDGLFGTEVQQSHIPEKCPMC